MQSKIVNIPLERYEQEKLTKWLELNSYTFSAIRNESDYRDIKKGAKRKREGVRKGISDFCIILHRKGILFIELKRQRKKLKNGNLGVSPSRVSLEQENWIKEVNKCDNAQANICYGADEAINLISKLEKET